MNRVELPVDEVVTRGRYRLTTPARTLVDTARSRETWDGCASRG